MDAVTNAIQDFDADNIVKNALTSQIDEREYSYKNVNNRNVLVTEVANPAEPANNNNQAQQWPQQSLDYFIKKFLLL